ncbi:MAG: HAD family phosphatase [Parcubacteria group bacterium]|nr:HAD family phosphatase [Parcubacteria group bacterium]
MIKAIIYDMDDVIVNTYPLAVKTEKILLKELGYDLSKHPEADLSQYIGMRTVDMFTDIKEKLNIKISIDELLKRRSELFINILQEKVEVLPGAKYSLELFRNKYKMALTSSGNKVRVNLILDQMNIKDYFEVIISGNDVKLGKPNPEPYLKTTEKLGLKPSECLVIEDAENGVKSAKSAGCRCIAIENKNTPKQDLSKADLVLESLEDINFRVVDSMDSKS